MARALVLLLLIAVVAHGEGEKKEKKAPKEEKVVCPATAEEVAKLKSELASAKTELTKTKESLDAANKNLKAATDAAKAAAGEVDYFMSVDELGDVISSVMPDVPEVKLDTAALTAQAQALSVQATEAAQSALGESYKHVGTISKTLQDLHQQHVGEKATNEYIEAATQLYNEHLAAHVAVARKAYNDQVHPHVAKISPTVMEAANAGMAHFSTLSKKATQGVGASEELSKQLGWLVKSQELKVLGRTFSFKYGYVDMFLGGVQAFLMAVFFLVVSWTVFYKIFARLGFKITIWSTKGTFTVSMFLTKIFFKLFRTTTGLAIQLAFFAAFSAAGVVAAHVANDQAKLGLPIRQRLLVGGISGFMFYFICWLICPCCKRRKPSNNVKDNSTNGKKENGAKAAPKKGSSAPATNGAKKAEAKKGPTKK